MKTKSTTKRVLFLSMLVCVFACSEKNLSSLSSTIAITDTEESVLESVAFISRIDTLPLNSRGEDFSSVQAACVTDSSIYIIDKMGAIGCFNIKTGHLEKKIRKVGHGNDEYVNPVSICEDDGYIYVLDFQGCAVLNYDLELNYKSRTKLEFPALDFTKTPNGFLFYNMNASGKLRRIVYTDMNGQIINSYLSKEKENNVMLADKMFCKDEGDVYFSDPSNDCLYKWKNEDLTPLYQIEIPKKKSNSHIKGKETERFDGQYLRSFVTNNQVISLFIHGGMVLANSYKRDLGDSYSGRVKTNIPYPFFPITIHKGCLYGLYEIMGVNDVDDASIMLVKYYINK